MRFIPKLFVLIVSISLMSSCEKTEGEGGTSTIMGQVYKINYNADFTEKLGEYYAPDVDVFIIYGEDSIYSDDFKTGINGWYRFEYLNKGTYTLYAFSEDSTLRDPSNMIPVKVSLTINENNTTYIADELIIFE